MMNKKGFKALFL